jgi:hypothetical protein
MGFVGMQSSQEKLLFAACEMLLSALYIYSDWVEQGKNICFWHPGSDGVLGFLIEEFGLYEYLWDSDRLDHEMIDNYERQESLSKALAEQYGTLPHKTHYALYCLWIQRLLSIFQPIIESPELGGTEYNNTIGILYPIFKRYKVLLILQSAVRKKLLAHQFGKN